MNKKLTIINLMKQHILILIITFPTKYFLKNCNNENLKPYKKVSIKVQKTCFA